MTEQPADEYRAELDFEISLADGGTLRGRDFRIDIDHAGVTEEVLAAALARELGLSAADQVDIHSRQVMRGRHRGSPAAVHRLPPPPDPEPALEPLPGPGPLPGMPLPDGGRAAAHPPLPAAASWPPIPAVPADSWPPLPPVAGMLAGDDDVTSPIAKAGNGSGHPGAVLAPHDSGPADSAFRGLGSHDSDLQHGAPSTVTSSTVTPSTVPPSTGASSTVPATTGAFITGVSRTGARSTRPGQPRRPPRVSGCTARTSATSSRTG